MKADLDADKTPEGEGKRENIDSLTSGIADFVQSQQEQGLDDHELLSDYLSTVSLLTDMDNDDSSSDKMTLMTIHSAKGLEFGTVFIVGMEENIFPSLMSADSKRGLEEERRLLYVAITRAEHHCYLYVRKMAEQPYAIMADGTESLGKMTTTRSISLIPEVILGATSILVTVVACRTHVL